MVKKFLQQGKLLLPCILMFIHNSCQDSPEKTHYRLWYKQPATEWTDALPVGNGRIGAMVFGNIQNERIQLNEESLWAGIRRNCNNPQSLNYLDEVQQLLLNDKNNEALDVAKKQLMGIPPRIRSYQTLGDVFIQLDIDSAKISEYERSLDLNTGIAHTRFNYNGQLIQREVFVSSPDNIVVIHINSGDKNVLSGKINLAREKDVVVKASGQDGLIMEGQITDEHDSQTGPGGKHMKFASILKILDCDGKVITSKNAISLKQASQVTILLTAATDYNLQKLNFDRDIRPVDVCKKILEGNFEKSYDQMKATHTEDHQEMFNRMSIQLGDSNTDTIPTDERLQNVIDGKKDDNLIALYFQYGRYLLMGSSREPGQLPANLQGIWNPYFNAPWNSDYHTNINVQMNYWPAEVCNLSETSLPYIHFFRAVSEPGAVTAKEMYGANGWTMHHATNVFGRTAIQDAIRHGMFPMGAAWVCFPVWRHFEFTMDTAYLENTGWPLIQGAVQFILDFLIESPEGYLVTAPSYSPENTFYLPESNEQMRLTYGPTMDIMIIRELFDYALKSMEILKTDDPMRTEIIEKRDSLPPVQIGANGTIQEWIKDYKEVEPGHRHISHLLGLHPGTQITEDNEALFEAARKTIEYRLSHGGGHTGWSRAWIINFYARLLNGEEAYKHLELLLQKSTLANLFDTHPPFQIDGNFGGTAGIAEMLIQSHRDYIHILPALPLSWKNGHITGIKARGNYTLDIEWKNGVLNNISINAAHSGPCKLKYRDRVITLQCEENKTYKLNTDFKLL